MRVLALALGLAAIQESVLFEEKFDGKLSDGWTWVREDPAGYKIEGGAVSIKAQPGSLWYKANNARNLLVRKLPAEVKADEGIAVEAAVASRPAANAEQAGLHWYVDDGNYIKLVREFLKGETFVVLAREERGVPEVVKQVAVKAESVQLRLVRTGGRISGQFREAEAGEWQTVGECAAFVKGDPQAGLGAYGGPADGDRFARFSKVRIVRVK